MGLFTPRYAKSDTPGAASAPARRESRAARKEREFQERLDRQLTDDFDRLHREMDERDARRSEAVERFNRRRG